MAAQVRKGKEVRFTGYSEAVEDQERQRGFEPDQILKVVSKRENRLEVIREDDGFQSVIYDGEYAFPATADDESEAPDPDDIEADEVSGPEGDAVELDTSRTTLPEVKLTPRIQSILEQHDDPLKAAKSLVRQSEETAYSLGGVLYLIHQENLHIALGFADGKRGFADYASKELGLEYRTAMYFIRIYYVFNRAGADEETVARLGWTKAKEIARVKDEQALLNGFPEMMDFAENHSRPELIEYIRDRFPEHKNENSGRLRPVRFTFKLDAARSQSTKNILDMIKKQADIPEDDDATAFAVILKEYAEMKGLKFEEEEPKTKSKKKEKAA